MRAPVGWLLGVGLMWLPSAAVAQSPRAATYITDEEVKAVLKNAPPAVDQQLVSVDIGKLNEAVGVIHRGPTPSPGASAAAARGPAGPAAGGTTMPAEPCGERSAAPPEGAPSGIVHDHQTETYIIVSGSGTLVTGGHIVNGRKSPPDSQVTRILNGPSCSGAIAGPDVVRRPVKAGDIIIIPAGVPHGWIDIADHVTYLSVRPDPDRVLPSDYLHPTIQKLRATGR
jgi:mannose-6-phosphate isomerase-like protein (cupin superfamily)